jgi:protein SCO1/2
VGGVPARVRLALMLVATFVLVAALAIVLFAPAPARPTAGFQGSTPPAMGPVDWTLTDQDGRRVRLADLRGGPVVVTFLYSTCEDTCPTTASTIRSALDSTGLDVPVLAVSVDPANDTPRRAKAFLAKRGLTGRMRFLLGTPAQLQPVWRSYGIQPQGEGFEHSAYVLLVDASGRYRVSWPFGKLTSDGLANDLRLLTAAGRSAS